MRKFFRIFAFVVVVVACGLTIETVRVRSIRSGDREALRIGIEDVARRVKTTTENLATVVDLNNRSILAKARALAQMVASDPTLLNDTNRFAQLCQKLDVDELHVSDEKGVLICSWPPYFVGYQMDSNPQSRPFMRAISDKSFELAQDPEIKGSDGSLFQYAGVARIDKPGIVQVGCNAGRVQEAKRLADIYGIATSMRIGRGGSVSISKVTRSHEKNARMSIKKVGGQRKYFLSNGVGSHIVNVSIPVYGTVLADDIPFSVICVLDGIIVLIALLTRLDSFRDMFGKTLSSLGMLFKGMPKGSGSVAKSGRTINPIIPACLLMFVFASAACWWFFAQYSKRTARERLLNAAAEMHEEIDGCIDQQLFYQGNAICKNYGSPEAMTVDAVKEVMKRYDIDELNVVDSRGVIIAGDLAEVGFVMASNPNSAKFNRLLEGVDIYSQPFRGAIENPAIRRKYVGVAFPPPAKGYVQIGFAEHRLKDGVDYLFAAMAKDLRVGERGFYIIAKAETGEIDSCGKLDASGNPVFREGDTLAGIGFNVLAAPKNPREFFTARLYGEECLCLSEVLSFHRCISAIPLSEISMGTLRTSLTTSALLLAVFIIVAVFMTRLSDLVASLKGYIADESVRAEKEMAMAKDIQANVLPSVFPPYPSLVDRIDIYAMMLTAREVGGDFYDFFFVGEGKLALVMADVSGKGIPAALFMMRAKATIQGVLKDGVDIAAAISTANDTLAASNDANMFVTAWIGVVDITTGDLEYVNAGHNRPLVKRKDGSVAFLNEKSGPPLAALGGVKYRKYSTKLENHEGLVLYTDGVTEAVNPKMELYGDDRLLDTMKGLVGSHDSSEILENIKKSVYAFADGAEQADDITLLAFKLN